jgi:hypothetical protein
MPRTSKRPIVVSYTVEFDPEEMSRRGKIGAHTLHSQYDSRELTTAAREAFLRKFETQVDPDETLPAEERKRRATHARKAHFARLALASARARKARSAKEPEHAVLGVSR